MLDEQEILQQTFDPLYVSEEEGSEAFAKMKAELATASAERASGKWTILILAFVDQGVNWWHFDLHTLMVFLWWYE